MSKFFKYIIFIISFLYLLNDVRADYSISRFDNSWCTSSYPTDYVTGSFSITEIEIHGNEGKNGLTKNQTDQTIIIDLPSGFEFKTSDYIATITATGTEISNISFVFNSVTRLTVTLTSSSVNDEYNTLNFNDFEIRAVTSGASGDILRNGGTFKIDNDAALPSASQSLGQLTGGTPYSYTSSTVTHTVPSTDSITQYSINNQIIRIQVTGTGNCSGEVTSFTFNTDGGNSTGTDSVRSISTAKVYYTGTSTTFSTTNFFGSYTSPGGSFSITGGQELVNGNNYFFLTYDIAGDAYTGSDGNKVDAKLESFVLNAETKTDMTVSAPVGYRVIKAASYYYSRVSGNWGNNSIWSLSDNGPDCSCQPNGAGVVIIDTNHTVAANVARIVDVIEIHQGAILSGGATSKTVTVNSYLKTFSTGKFTLSQTLNVKGNALLAGTGIFSNSQPIDIDGDLTVGSGTTLTANGVATIGGNLTVNGTFNGSSTITMDGGYYTLSGTGTISNTSQVIITNGDKTIPAGANLTISTDFLIDGDWTITNNGTVTLSGNLDGTSGLSNWTNAASSTLYYGGTEKMFISGGEFQASANNNVVNYNGASAQYIMPPNSMGQFYNITLSGAGAKTLFDDIKVKGNWTNNSTFIHNSKNVTMNGAVAQSISGTSLTTFNTLTVNNSYVGGSNNVTLNQSVNIDATVTFTKGNINLNGYVITLCPTCYLSGESNTKRIYGTTGYVQITQDINAPSSLNPGNLGAVFTSAANFGSTNIKRGHSVQVGLGNQGILRYYDISPTNTTGLDATFGFYYFDNELNGLTEANFKFYRSIDGGTIWTELSPSTTDYTLNYLTLVPVSTFPNPSRWTLSNSVTNPLPVELLSFNGIYENGKVNLYWETASETNNDYFIVERSVDGENFEIVTTVKGAGNSSTILKYSATDDAPPVGVVYYRLRQTDFNGDFEYSNIISVRVDAVIRGISVGQPYFDGSSLVVNVENTASSTLHVEIFNILGALCYSETYFANQGNLKLNVNTDNLDKRAVYFLRIKSGQETIVKKFVY